MQTWIALLRGINVGGKNVLPMATLKSLLESRDCEDVRTYIQSGNAVFRSPVKSRKKMINDILDSIENQCAFRPKLVLFTSTEFLEAKKNNPFLEAVAAPKTVHFFFLESQPQIVDTKSMAEMATDTERFLLIERVLYLHTPEGFGNSKLAANVERRLGVTATARNYTTVEKIIKMLSIS